jgi:hypothetical protein
MITDAAIRNLQPGDTVIVQPTHGIVTAPARRGKVTHNDPKSPYIVIDGYQYRKYEVIDLA